MDEKERSRFLELIFDDNPGRSHASWVRAYESVQRYQDQLTTLTTRSRYETTFITDFDQFGGRILKFLRNADNYLPRTPEGYRSRRSLGALMIDKLMMRLLDDQYGHLRDRETLFELLMCMLLLADHTNHLRGLAASLAHIPSLLGKVISSDSSSDFLGDWVDSIGKSHPNATTLGGWTEVAADLVDGCVGGHDVDEVLDRWKSLKRVKEQLHASQTGLKSNPGYHITFSDDMQTLLRDFRLSPPHSEATLSSAIEVVDITFTFEILTTLIESMPCRLCFSNCTGGGSAPVMTSRLRRGSRGKGWFDETEVDQFHYEDLLGKGLGRWKIVLSAQALKDLQNSRFEGNLEHIWSKLEDISTGDWVRKSVAKPVSIERLKFRVRLFQAMYGSNGRVLWQVDQGYNESIGAACQIVRVWRIGDVKEINERKSYELIYRTQRSWSVQRVADCKVNRVDEKNAIKIPAIFGDREDTTEEAQCDDRGFENRTALDILITGKFHTLTNRMFDNIISENQDAEFPFDVNGTESRIIKHFRTAAFILGRSGTGKTTCLLYKLLSRYLVSAENGGFENRLRQVLLTRSEPLSRKLRLELRRLIKTQLVGAAAAEDDSRQDRAGDEENAVTLSLFSLQPEDFPLVCTFKYFMALLENTIKAHDRQNFDISKLHGHRVGDTVDFTIFKAAYWPKLRASKRMDAGLVFSEIMGVIKGAGSSKNGFCPLSREEYIARSLTLAPSFPTQSDRVRLYDLYENYERIKTQRGEYDSIDKVTTLLNVITIPSMKRKLYDIIQEIYVDEVQDQRTIEIELLLHLVQNPRGIHFAGDSAQCISNDSAFRFANVKALFYEHYISVDPELAKPELFSLTKNFRSHQGILSLASFVMSLLWKGFPNMVDKLSPEIGQYLGPRPTVFVGPAIADLLKMAGDENSASDQQIIIVRDEETRDSLQSKLRSNSIIFTILESKGMEYDDVYIYDFFSYSPYASGWRTLDALLPEGSNKSYAGEHMTMCSELKNLYVAITRPRSRLWILESRQNPFMDLLTNKLNKPLVNIRFFELHDLKLLMPELRPVTATTKEEWSRTGIQCMDQGIYEQALRCFQNAGDQENTIWAQACIAEQEGREQRARGEMREFKKSFEQATEDFLAIGMLPKAANCLEALGEYTRAAAIWSDLRQYQRAGELFERAGVSYIPQAADQYYKANLPVVALNLLLRGGHYVKVVDGLALYQNKITKTERKVMARQLNTLLRQGKIPNNLKEKTFNLLASDDEKKEFLKEYKHFDELWRFLQERERLDEAFEELVKADEFDLLLKRSYQANENWQSSRKTDLAEIYNASNAKRVMACLTASTKGIDITANQTSDYANAVWAQEWATFLSSNSCKINTGKLPTKNDLGKESAWSVDFMSTVLTFFPEGFLKDADSLAQLSDAVAYIWNMSTIVASSQYTSGVLSCLGLLRTPGHQEYRPFPWSMMVANRAAFEKRLMVKVSEIEKVLFPRVERAMQQVHQMAQELFPKLGSCIHCVGRETWDLARAKDRLSKRHQCHQQLSPASFRRRLESLVETCHMLGKIKQNCPSSSANRCYDHCSFYLLNLFSYQSAYGQDARIIADVSRRLSTESSYAILLEDFQRQAPLSPASNRKWTEDDSKWTQNDLSSVLDKYRLLQTLGILTPKVLPTELQEEYQGTLETPLQMLKYYRDLQSNTGGGEWADLSTMLNQSADLVEYIDHFVSYNHHKLKSYSSSIISLVEDLATLLLFSGWRSEILIPKSWGILYLPHWVQFLANHSDTMDESDRTESRKAMYRLTWIFFNMVDRLEGLRQNIAPDIREVLSRRSVDFLVVVLVNIGMMSPQPSKYKELFADAQKFFDFNSQSLKTKSILNLPCKLLLKSLRNAFTYYNDKDHLCLYICGEQSRSIQRCGRTAWLKTLGIEVESRPDVTSKDVATDVISSDKTSSTLTTFLLEWNAVNLIQRAFRDYQRRKAEKRAQAATRIQICTRRFLKRKAEQRAKAATMIQTAFRTYQRRREEKRAKAARVILRAYRGYQRKKAVQKAQGVIRRACIRYKRDKGYFRSPEGVAVAKIQAVCHKRKVYAKPKLTTKEYLKRLVVMLTEGVSLCIEIESLHNKYTTIIALKNRHSLRQDKYFLNRIDGIRTVLFQDSLKFNALNSSEEGLRKRISEGMSLVEEAKEALKSAENDIRKESLKSSAGSANQQQTTMPHSPSQAPKPVEGGNKAKVDINNEGDNQAGGSKADVNQAADHNAGGSTSKKRRKRRRR
ncbi:hypothetical protein EV426DRAFT_718708 [Tirmania nivea]|nr:hypothetical protein EV426DRAFT_718708 [Tirmania nivea]